MSQLELALVVSNVCLIGALIHMHIKMVSIESHMKISSKMALGVLVDMFRKNDVPVENFAEEMLSVINKDYSYITDRF